MRFPNIFYGVLLVFLMTMRSYGQQFDQKIGVPAGTMTLEEALIKANESQPVFAYSADLLPKKTITIPSDQLTLKQFLKLLEKHGIQSKTIGTQILLSAARTPIANFKKSIRGVVREKGSGELMIGATVKVRDTNTGVVTNNYGYYSLTLSPDTYILEVSFIGYETLLDTIELADKNKTINYEIALQTLELTEVTIAAREADFNISSTIPSVNSISLNTKGQIPYFLGEVDVLQGALLLPGISALGEDANGINVRGGSVDQNLILLDESTVYNPNHLFGLISIFNPEAVNNIEVMKGFIPPSYGGRASSVITVHQKEGNDDEFHLTGGIGLVSARFIAEGPLKKKVSSFIVSGRQSLLNLSLDDSNTSSNFQDLNAKVNWKANKNNNFYLSGYLGNDRNENNFERVRIWGNRNASLRWNHLFGPRVFGNFSAIASQYNYKISQPQEAASFIGQSKVNDYTLKADFGYTLSPQNEFNFGGSTIFHRLKPGDRIPFEENTSSSTPLSLDNEYGIEAALYVSHESQITNNISTLYGVRVSSLHNLGPGNVFMYEDSIPRSDNSIVDTITYDRLEKIVSFYGFEPRVSLVFRLSKSSSIKASYSKTYQYLHLISNTVTPSPTDIWKLTDTYIPPVNSQHYSLGYYQNFKEHMYEAYLEGFYKHQTGIIEYKDGADLLFNENPETELLKGDGRSYGLEFFLAKMKGKLTGWVSYTLARSEVQVDGKLEELSINSGNYFPANHDKKHDLSVVGIYEITPRISSSLSFNFNSGRPFTLPTDKYQFEEITVPDFDQRNQSRLPDYHRLDLSVKLEGKKIRKNGEPRKYQDYWTFVVYNVYSRSNVYSYSYENVNDGSTRIVPNSIFDTIIPALTYHFKF